MTFRLDHVSMIEPGAFTSVANLIIGGEPNAVSLDFGEVILRQLCEMFPEAFQFVLQAAGREKLSAEGTVDLDAPILIKVEAKLGRPQRAADDEEFVPLVVQSVTKV